MSSTLREMRAIFLHNVTSKRVWVVFGSVAALFVLVGPFGTYLEMNALQRAVYWSSTMFGSWLIALTVIAGVLPFFPTSGRYPLMGMIVATMLASPIIALWNHSIISAFYAATREHITYLELLATTVPMTMLFGFLSYAATAPDLPGTEPSTEATPERENLLMKRLPVEKRGAVKHMSMQDHYVAVTTTRGRELVLMRMSDAIAELDDTHGLQIHRSHWLDPDHIAETRRTDGRVVFVMDDGTELPVSRTYMPAVREAGLIV